MRESISRLTPEQRAELGHTPQAGAQSRGIDVPQPPPQQADGADFR